MSIQDYAGHRGYRSSRERFSRDEPMEFLHWNDLSRPAKKALARLLGGGSLRGVEREATYELYRYGLIDDDDHYAQLTLAGWDTLKSSRDSLRRV